MKNFFKSLLVNVSHLPSTIAGAAAVVSGIVQSPAVQQLAGMSPVIANYVTGVGAVSAGLLLIFGIGKPSPAAE